MPNAPPTYLCPVDAPVQVGGKWKLVLLFYLLQQPRRTGELRRLVPEISQKMLTQQLRELEDDGVVTRTAFDRVPPKVVYDIAEAERARLRTLLDALCEWGLYWCGKAGASAQPQATARVVIRDPGDVEAPLYEAELQLRPDGQPLTTAFTSPATADTEFQLQLGGNDAAVDLCLDLVSMTTGGEVDEYEPDTGQRVRLNQVGYLPNGPKVATLVSDEA